MGRFFNSRRSEKLWADFPGGQVRLQGRHHVCTLWIVSNLSLYSNTIIMCDKNYHVVGKKNLYLSDIGPDVS